MFSIIKIVILSQEFWDIVFNETVFLNLHLSPAGAAGTGTCTQKRTQ